MVKMKLHLPSIVHTDDLRSWITFLIAAIVKLLSYNTLPHSAFGHLASQHAMASGHSLSPPVPLPLLAFPFTLVPVPASPIPVTRAGKAKWRGREGIVWVWV